MKDELYYYAIKFKNSKNKDLKKLSKIIIEINAALKFYANCDKLTKTIINDTQVVRLYDNGFVAKTTLSDIKKELEC